ncbi:MAG TPA: polysaccharide pyruvyl transferase family protein [Bacteroides ovatus]|jgi:hypothetical protein|nr:polysaccharide pyruvyl transferase family protein [Bacteroides ovatus]HCJ24799.1 polysaccharide pyruvyl transferase family protein [Bacteroides ovatus]
MEICTITCHRVYNYGASLQAFALQYYLESLGHKVEIIDYLPYYHQSRYNFFYIPLESNHYTLFSSNGFMRLVYGILKNLCIFKTWGRKKKFDDFTKSFLKLTSTHYETIEELKDNPPIADIYVAGSDQIWNTEMYNGKDPAYYLDFGNPSTKRISYAASIAVGKIEKGLEGVIRNRLSKFSQISVREASGVEIVGNLGIKAELVLDPVFLLEKREWLNMVAKGTQRPEKIKSRYILVYDFLHDDRIRMFVAKLKDQYGVLVVSINDYRSLNYADVNINDAGPLEFLDLVANADYIVSNSFHATAFSIILEKEFYVYPLMRQNNSSRMEDLLRGLGLEKRFNPSEIQKNINYEIVKELLEYKRVKSVDFINDSL